MMKSKLLHFEINKILLFSLLGILLMCSVASAAYIEVKNISEYCDSGYEYNFVMVGNTIADTINNFSTAVGGVA